MKREGLAAALVLTLLLPLGYMFVHSMIDSRARASEAPFRAVLGNQRFEALMEGQSGFPHYLGQSLLAPDFTAVDRDGTPWKLSEHRGKVIVLNFWTITCGPCIREMPTLELLATIAKKWADVTVVALSVDRGWNDARPFVNADSGIEYLFDPERKIVSDMFGTKLFPETWIIDKNGIVRFRYDGGRDWSDPVLLDLINAYR